MKNPVGPILRMGDTVELVIAAIRDDNPDKEIEIIDRGSYVRVQGEDRLRVTQETLRGYLGGDFSIANLGNMMPSFQGRVVSGSEEFVWESIRPPAGAQTKKETVA